MWCSCSWARKQRSLARHTRAPSSTCPALQEELAAEIAKTGKPIIAVIMAGRPLTFANLANRAKAILYAWHPGTMGGPAIADVLFGNVAPSGKLPVTFPRTVGQVPIYYAQLNTGRPPSPKDLGIPLGSPRDPTIYLSEYIDVDYTPAYPFGFGLSYAHFAYSNLRLSAGQVRLGGSLSVSAEITNDGTREADEVVQLYTRDLVASVARPIRELKRFQPRSPQAGPEGDRDLHSQHFGTRLPRQPDAACHRAGEVQRLDRGRFSVRTAGAVRGRTMTEGRSVHVQEQAATIL